MFPPFKFHSPIIELASRTSMKFCKGKSKALKLVISSGLYGAFSAGLL
jgi:hypothetical protein